MRLPPPPPRRPPELVIVHEDADLVVLDKPAGALAVPGRDSRPGDDLWTLARMRWPDARVVHRLDQATSGLWLLARGEAAQRRLSQAFESRQVLKHYEALVHGLVDAADGEIRLALGAHWPDRPRQRVDPEHGRDALTRWRRIGHEPPFTRLALQPVTGRTHQLRVHLQAIGHPIVGDALYGAPDDRPRLHLHACALALPHPGDDRPCEFSSPAPF